MKNSIIYIFAALVILGVSCTEPLDYDYESGLEPVLLVEGKITTDTLKHFVILSKTTSLNNPEQVWETDAQVTISNSKGTIALIEEEPGHYYTEPDVYGEIGETYELEIILANGDQYSAVSYIQDIPEIDSIKVLWEDQFGYGEFYHNVYFHGWELPEEDNAYLWNLYMDDSLYNDTIWKTNYVDDSFVNGNYIGLGPKRNWDTNGVEIFNPETSNFPIYFLSPEDVRKDTIEIMVEMESLPYEYFEFWVSFMQQTVWVGSPFDPAKADPANNITNGALGYFYGASVKRANYTYIAPEHSKGYENPFDF